MVNNSSQTFLDGEQISCSEIISSGLLGNTTIAAGSPLASTIETDASAIGSSFQIDNGVYFIRGNFVNVSKSEMEKCEINSGGDVGGQHPFPKEDLAEHQIVYVTAV